MYRTFALLMAGTLLGACDRTPTLEDAQRMAQESLIIDTHIDVPYRLHRKPADISVATEGGDFDHPRAVAGGLNAPFMSVYIPADVDEAGEAYTFANALIDDVTAIAATYPTKFALATCSDDVLRNFERGVISLPMGMENGGPVAGSEANLRHFFNRGIRYITLTHARANHISDSSYDENERWQGLSEFGKSLIAMMNRLGIMIDVSHISDAAFWQVLELSSTPVLATHSSLRTFTPGFQRNMTDAMVQALAAAGGVIQINFGSGFLTATARDYAATRRQAFQAYLAESGLLATDPKVLEFGVAYRDQHPYPYASLDDVLEHIDHAVQIAGIDAVGIGSDYDGVGDSLPDGLKDVSAYPNLILGLMQRGYSAQDIGKILGGNTLRVWRAVEAFAAHQGTAPQCVG